MDNEMNNVTNDIEVNDIFEEEVNLTRSESREQAFMLLFSKSFDDEPLEETIDDNSEMFVGGVCTYAQAVVSGIEGMSIFNYHLLFLQEAHRQKTLRTKA